MGDFDVPANRVGIYDTLKQISIRDAENHYPGNIVSIAQRRALNVAQGNPAPFPIDILKNATSLLLCGGQAATPSSTNDIDDGKSDEKSNSRYQTDNPLLQNAAPLHR